MNGNPGRFAGKSVLVTGGVSGIGRAICEALIREGGTVLAADIRDRSRDDGLSVEDLAAHWGSDNAIVVGDVSDQGFVAQLFNARPIDVVINSAGVTNFKELGDLEFADYRKMFDVNFGGVFNTSKLATERWIADSRTGTIVNVASNLGLVGSSAGTLYCASKAAVVMFTRSLAVEVGARGIRANCLCPGVVETEFNADFRAVASNLEQWERATPLRREGRAFGSVADVSEAALFLASDASSYMTGSELVIDGGWNAS